MCMATFAYIGDPEMPDSGGGILEVVRSAPWAIGTRARIRIVTATGAVVAEANSGVPGDVVLDGGVAIHVLSPFPADPSVRATMAHLRAYSPRLAVGEYSVRVDTLASGTWTEQGVATPAFIVRPRLRLAEVYALRQDYPEVYATGPRSLDEDR